MNVFQELPTASVVICFYNEELNTLLRCTLHNAQPQLYLFKLHQHPKCVIAIAITISQITKYFITSTVAMTISITQYSTKKLNH